MRQAASRDVENIVFLGEQDGPAEQRLKERLEALFEQNAGVSGAYLARALVDGEATVVLGLQASGVDESELARKIGAVFASIFNARAHLDVVLLSDAQVAAAGRLCRAFYERASASC
jgi:hypothetical protein